MNRWDQQQGLQLLPQLLPQLFSQPLLPLLPQQQNRRMRMMIQQQLLPPKLKHDIIMSSLKSILKPPLPFEASVS